MLIEKEELKKLKERIDSLRPEYKLTEIAQAIRYNYNYLANALIGNKPMTKKMLSAIEKFLKRNE